MKKPPRAECVRLTVQDLVKHLLWDDRKEDEWLPRGEIEAAVAAGEISVEEIVRLFETHLRAGLE